ncbi:MAG: CPBP family intramembrane metalloprotease [Sulfobacillus acidophilus]|uniref:CPBP family intramembrane metalloprotease n=1 Tax=Sulfobacillus acidophilus TaxID=53633 RepID=A0A2T2WHE1_9FIRM|nr:MAG: CPBP family intramembrane metalloprotease [Sulfobacillus acidophilus]
MRVLLEHEVAVAFAAGFFSFIAVSLLLGWLHLVDHESVPSRLGAVRFFTTAFLFLPMALVEEFLFRWLAIGQLSRITGLIPAFLFSIVAFVVAHRPNGRLRFTTILNLAIVSVILGLVFLQWGLWVVAAAHAGWNLAEWGLGYAVSGQKTRAVLPSPARREVKDEPFGPEGHAVATVVLLLVLAVLLTTARLHL